MPLLAGICCVSSHTTTASAADLRDVAVSGLEFSGSVGKLLWVTTRSKNDVTRAQADQYTKLALSIKDEIEIGRASSGMMKAHFDFVATTLAYAAVVDPEPLSKGVAAVAAWGAKKAGDALGQMVMDQSERQGMKILAQGLKNSGLSNAQLQNMTAAQLRAKVTDLQVGGQKIGEILRDNPEAIRLLQANAVDLATNIGVLALSRAEGTAADVQKIKTDLVKTTDQLTAFQKEVDTHLEKIESRLGGLEKATAEVSARLSALDREVQGQGRALQTMAQVSYAGWNTSQKLQAVQGGLFPDLTEPQKKALVDSLKAERAREMIVTGIQQAAQDLGNLATIAGNLGLPADVTKGLQGAQLAATGIAQFATGNYLGAIASLTSIGGLGAPDAGAERHKQMMQYLDQRFAEVNNRLTKIIELQVETLKAVAALATEQREFRREVLGQLDRIERTVLRSEQILQAISLSKWTNCHALVNGTALNGQFAIPTREVLAGVVANRNTPAYASDCYSTLAGFLDAWVKSAKWSGQIISADNFPTQAIATEPALQKGWQAFQAQRIEAYRTARNFVLEALPDAGKAPAAHLARLAQPVVDATYASKLEDSLKRPEIELRMRSFRCSDTDVLSEGLKELACFGLVEGASTPPLPDRWRDLLMASLIGPHASGLIDTGMVLATISDFAVRKNSGVFEFVDRTVIERFAENGPTSELRSGLAQRKGEELLQKLRWLTEASVLQQSVTYGDYTATLVEASLYDPATRTLNLAPEVMTPLKQSAVSAMRANPILARNVVTLAMRHARADAEGGRAQAERVSYNRGYYGMALAHFRGPQACTGSVEPRRMLSELFPKWQFDLRVTSAEKQDAALSACLPAIEPDPNSAAPAPYFGSGIAVTLAPDFYVLVPTAPALATGLFEQPDSLRVALAYRDRVSQALVDRRVAALVKNSFGAGAKDAAFALLNEGWSWQRRPTSN